MQNKPVLIDTHCHLNLEYFENPEKVILESVAAGVQKMISIGTNIKTINEVCNLAKDNPNIFAAIGIYPHEEQGKSIKELYEFLSKTYVKNQKKIVAIGECGLDLSGKDSKERPLDEQKELFKMQMGFSVEHNLPLIIHNRGVEDEIIKILQKYPKDSLKGVFHCFVQDWEFAKKVLALGFSISFTPIITFKSAGEKLIETVKNIPNDKFMIETDAPLLDATPRGVIRVAKQISKIKDISLETICEVSTKNATKLFTKLA